MDHQCEQDGDGAKEERRGHARRDAPQQPFDRQQRSGRPQSDERGRRQGRAARRVARDEEFRAGAQDIEQRLRDGHGDQPSRIPPRSHVIGCRRQNRVDAPTSAVAHGRVGSADAAIAGRKSRPIATQKTGGVTSTRRLDVSGNSHATASAPTITAAAIRCGHRKPWRCPPAPKTIAIVPSTTSSAHATERVGGSAGTWPGTSAQHRDRRRVSVRHLQRDQAPVVVVGSDIDLVRASGSAGDCASRALREHEREAPRRCLAPNRPRRG